MPSLFLLDCYTNEVFTDLSVINWDDKIVSFVIDAMEVISDSSEGIYQARMVVTPEFKFYDFLIQNPNTYGFRLETENNNLGFLIKDKRILVDGTLEIDLVSTLYLLTETFSAPDLITSSEGWGIIDIVNKLSNRFLYTILGDPEAKVVITGGLFTDYEILKQIVKYKEKYLVRENKLVSIAPGIWKPELLIGRFDLYLEDLYFSNPYERKECKPVYLTNYKQFDDITDTDIIYVNNFKIEFPSATPNRVFVFGDSGNGLAPNARIDLDPTLIDQAYLDQQDIYFPIEYKIVNGKKYFYVVNVFADQSPVREKVIVIDTNTGINENNEEVDRRANVKKLYSYAKSYCSAIKAEKILNFESSALTKKLILPGNILNVDLIIKAEDKSGNKRIIDEIHEKRLLKVTDVYDLNNIFS
jgi:hypothetical protein